jgi:hypothetical protein
MYWKKYEIDMLLPILRYSASHLHKGIEEGCEKPQLGLQSSIAGL